jgi:hypothetical protein
VGRGGSIAHDGRLEKQKAALLRSIYGLSRPGRCYPPQTPLKHRPTQIFREFSVTSNTKATSPDKKAAQAKKDKRLAEALRANLRRRKGQKQDRAAEGEGLAENHVDPGGNKADQA